MVAFGRRNVRDLLNGVTMRSPTQGTIFSGISFAGAAMATIYMSIVGSLEAVYDRITGVQR